MPASAAELMMMDGEANVQTPFSGQNGSRSARWIIFRLLSSLIEGQHLNPAVGEKLDRWRSPLNIIATPWFACDRKLRQKCKGRKLRLGPGIWPSLTARVNARNLIDVEMSSPRKTFILK